MERILTRATKVGILEQDDFETVGADSGTYEEIYVDASSVKLNHDILVSGFDHTSKFGLLPIREQNRNSNDGALARLTFTMPATRQNIALFFAAALHKARESASTPFQKVITAYYATQVPDFQNAASKEPHIFTMAIEGQYSGGGITVGLLTKAVVDKLRYRQDFNNRGVSKLGYIDVEMVGQFDDAGGGFSGSFTPKSQTFYNDSTVFDFSTSSNGVIANASLRSFELNINANVNVATRTTDGYIIDYVLVNPEITASFKFPSVSGSYNDLYGYLTAGTEIIASGVEGTTGNAGYLNITVRGRMTNNDFLSHEDGYEHSTITIRCEYNDTSNAEPITVTIADAVDRNWLAP